MTDTSPATPPETPATFADPTSQFTPSVTQEDFYKSLDDFDAAELPSPWEGSFTDGSRNTPEISLDAFSPETRDRLNARAAEINGNDIAAGLKTAIGEELRRNAINVRVQSMQGSNAQYHREIAAIECEIEEARRQSMVIGEQLNQKRTVVDPFTGKLIDSGEFVITGDRRKEMGIELGRLFAMAERIANHEGPRRLDEAKQADWAAFLDRERSAWELTEIERRAQIMASESRINKQAAARAAGRYRSGQ